MGDGARGPVAVPGELVGGALLLIGVGLLVVQGMAGIVFLAVLLVGGIGALVWWWRWFPRRATAELNKVIRAGTRMGWRAKLRRVRRRGPVYEIAWRVPTGITVASLVRYREVMEQA